MELPPGRPLSVQLNDVLPVAGATSQRKRATTGNCLGTGAATSGGC